MSLQTENSGFLMHVVDDDDEMREALQALLATRRIETQLYGSAEEFLAAIPAGKPVCALVDVRLPGLNGLEMIQELKRRETPAALIVMSGHGDISMAVAAMRAGALHFVEKPFDPVMLLDLVEEARERMLQIDTTSRICAEIRARLDDLTPREREVMSLLVEGLPSKLVARRLGISPRTAEHHRAAVMHKMAARTLSHLVRMAMTIGMVDLDSMERSLPPVE
jgi:FixJ family two-component response regulator